MMPWRQDIKYLRVRLETTRFVVKTICPDDVGDQYISWFNEPEVKSFITYKPSRENALEDLRQFVAHHDARGDSLLFGVFESISGHIANIKYEPIEIDTRRAVLGVLIGDKRWRGVGLFQEVFEATARFLSDNWGIESIQLSVANENLAARRAYERAGFLVTRERHCKNVSLHMEFTLSPQQ